MACRKPKTEFGHILLAKELQNKGLLEKMTRGPFVFYSDINFGKGNLSC